MQQDEATLVDLHKASTLALRFVEGVSQDTFLKDHKSQAAVLHELMIIGEAVKRLSLTFRKSHPEIPWRAISGMRDKLIHAYDVVDLDEVWKTLCTDVPKLLAFLDSFVSPNDRI